MKTLANREPIFSIFQAYYLEVFIVFDGKERTERLFFLFEKQNN